MSATISYSLYVRRFDGRRVPAGVDLARQLRSIDDLSNVIDLRHIRDLKAYAKLVSQNVAHARRQRSPDAPNE